MPLDLEDLAGLGPRAISWNLLLGLMVVHVIRGQRTSFREVYTIGVLKRMIGSVHNGDRAITELMQPQDAHERARRRHLPSRRRLRVGTACTHRELCLAGRDDVSEEEDAQALNH